MKPLPRLCLFLVCLGVFLSLGCDPGPVRVTLLQTSDVHHHADGYGPSADYTPALTGDGDGVVGGYARLAARIREVRREQARKGVPVVLLDAGDFSVGTIFDLATEDPVGLRFLEKMRYAAATIGNHELDYGPAGLASMILSARGHADGFGVPLVASNLSTSEEDPRDDTLQELLDDGAIRESLTLELCNGLTVGILGLLGPGAEAVVPTSAPLIFDHDVISLQAHVDHLRDEAGADLVILLSHEGIEADGSGYDAELAASVQGIDVIASGHTHVRTLEPVEVGDTLIMAPGEYGEGICRLDIAYDRRMGGVEERTFTAVDVEDEVRASRRIQRWVDGVRADIDAALASLFGEAPGLVSRTAFDLEVPAGSAEETGLGNLVGDAVLDQAAAAVAGSEDETPVRFGMLPNGLVRDPIRAGATGAIPFDDVYNVLPFGNSPAATLPDANPTETLLGYPLVTFYVNAQGLFALCDIPVSLAQLPGMSVYHLNFGGIEIAYTATPNPATTLRVQEVTFTDDRTTLTVADLADTTTVYRGAGDFFTVMMLAQSFAFPFKNREGGVLDLSNPLALRIDTDPAAEGCQELKTWQALQGYLEQSFPASGEGITGASVYTAEHIAANPRFRLLP